MIDKLIVFWLSDRIHVVLSKNVRPVLLIWAVRPKVVGFCGPSTLSPTSRLLPLRETWCYSPRGYGTYFIYLYFVWLLLAGKFWHRPKTHGKLCIMSMRFIVYWNVLIKPWNPVFIINSRHVLTLHHLQLKYNVNKHTLTHNREFKCVSVGKRKISNGTNRHY